MTRSRTLLRFAGPLTLAAVFITLLSLTWLKWPDLLHDTGHELYIPWQLSEGKIFFRDLVWLWGPLSQYFHAALFVIFGPSLLAIVLSNVVVLALTVAFVYRIGVALTDRFLAWLISLVLIAVFAFPQYGFIGGLSLVLPHAHEATHGLLLSAIMIDRLIAFQRTMRRRDLIIAGIALGLTFLTRADISMAAFAAAGTWLWASGRTRSPAHVTTRSLLVFFAAAALPPFASLIYFAVHMPPSDAFSATIGAWSTLITTPVTRGHFFKEGLGFDNVPENIFLMARSTGYVLCFVVAAFVVDVACSALKTLRTLFSVSVSFFLFLLLGSTHSLINWEDLPRAFPVLLALTLTLLARRFLRHPMGDEARARLIGALTVTVFALALLAKMILNVRIHHYGYYLAFPAAAVIIAALVRGIPSAIVALAQSGNPVGRGFERRPVALAHFSRATQPPAGSLIALKICQAARGDVMRFLAVAFVLAGTAVFQQWGLQAYALKSYPVGQGGDALLDYTPPCPNRGLADGAATEKIVRLILDQVPPSATLVVLPEGVGLNYITRRASPLRYIQYTPTEIDAYGEGTILAALIKTPPDFIVLIHRPYPEFGVGRWGIDPQFGKQIMDWVREHYAARGLVGAEPFSGPHFGAALLARRGNALSGR